MMYDLGARYFCGFSDFRLLKEGMANARKHYEDIGFKFGK